jgi:hypothetical protein
MSSSGTFNLMRFKASSAVLDEKTVARPEALVHHSQ